MSTGVLLSVEPGPLRLSWGPKEELVRPWIEGLGWFVTTAESRWSCQFTWRHDGRGPTVNVAAQRDATDHNLPAAARIDLIARLVPAGLALWHEARVFAPGGIAPVALGSGLRPAELELFGGRPGWPANVTLSLRFARLVDFYWHQDTGGAQLSVYLPDTDPTATHIAREQALGLSEAEAQAFAARWLQQYPNAGDNREFEPIDLRGPRPTPGRLLTAWYGAAAAPLAVESAAIGEAFGAFGPPALARFVTAVCT